MPDVLIAVDGSDASVTAIRTSVLLFPGARFTLVNAAEAIPLTPPLTPIAGGITAPMVWETGAVRPGHDGTGADAGDELTDPIEIAADVARRTGVEAGLDAPDVVGVRGDPAQSILELADERHVDVIVVGTHERGWLTRLLTSSVADEVRRGSHLPVLVVPTPAHTPATTSP